MYVIQNTVLLLFRRLILYLFELVSEDNVNSKKLQAKKIGKIFYIILLVWED